MQAKHGAHFLSAAQLELAQSAPLLDPAKHLLDAAAISWIVLRAPLDAPAQAGRSPSGRGVSDGAFS